jgi:hypothetical protein
MSPGLLHRLRDEVLRNRRAGQLNNALRSTGENERARYTAARSRSATGGVQSGPGASADDHVTFANGDVPRAGYQPERMSEPTLASTWYAASGGAIADELLDWPPDVFALTNVILARSEAFRFAISPVGEWPPDDYPDWARLVEEAGLY